MKKLLLTVMLCLGFSMVSAQPGYALLGDYIEEIDVAFESLDRYFPEVEETKGSGEIAVFEANQNILIDVNPDSNVSWELDFNFQHVFLSDNGSSIDLPALLVGRSMRVATQFPIPLLDDDRYRIGMSVIPTYFTDSWDDSFNDFETGAFRWLSEYWVEFRGTDNLSWKAGIKVRPEYDQVVLPVIGMDYRFNDRWSFRLTSDDIGLVYKYNDKIQFFSEHRYVLDEYEITESGVDGRVLRHKQNTTGVGMKYQINEKSYLKFSVGAAYNRNFKFVDGQDNRQVRLDETVYTTFEFVWNF